MEAETKEVSRDELLTEADELARGVLGVGHQEAFLRLDQGEFSGTIFASKMAAIRFLLGPEDSRPLAAE